MLLQKTLYLQPGRDLYCDPEFMRLEEDGWQISHESGLDPQTRLIKFVMVKESRTRNRNGSLASRQVKCHDW